MDVVESEDKAVIKQGDRNLNESRTYSNCVMLTDSVDLKKKIADLVMYESWALMREKNTTVTIYSESLMF